MNEYVRQTHYSGTAPSGDFVFKAEYEGRIVGAAIFGYPASGERGHHLRELRRLCLDDNVAPNSESRFIAWCIRYIRKHAPDIEYLISYADTAQGHEGTIYRASNWHYVGKKDIRPFLVIDGEVVHPRTAYDKYGTSSLTRLREMGIDVALHPVPPKHRYVYPLRQSTRPDGPTRPWTPTRKEETTKS